MPHVLSLKPVSITSLSGHSARVEPNIPKEISPQILKEALAAGCVLCNAEGEILVNGQAFKLVPGSAPAAPAAPEAPAAAREKAALTREQKIKEAVEALCDEGNPANFNSANGLLKVAVVSEKAGFKVSSEEIRAAQPAASTDPD